MKRFSPFIGLAILFLAISGSLYYLHYFIFRDPHHIFLYLIGDLAFLPLEVFLVVIVIERILSHREKQAMMKKLNMVIGAFFSEVGNNLLHHLLGCFDNQAEIRQKLAVSHDWTHANFKKAVDYANSLQDKPRCISNDMENLKSFLVLKREFLLGLLENPNLLEYERFTALLWATFHLTEELEARPSFTALPDSDLIHLSGDIQRVYHHLAAEWVFYTEHLKSSYPFLFSLIVRMQPFKESPSPVVK